MSCPDLPDSGVDGFLNSFLNIASGAVQDANDAFGVYDWSDCPGMLDKRSLEPELVFQNLVLASPPDKLSEADKALNNGSATLAPPLATVPPITVTDAPTFTEAYPEIGLSPLPPHTPVGSPTIDRFDPVINLPPTLNADDIKQPGLQLIAIPHIPSFTFSKFDAPVPSTAISVPRHSFSFSQVDYTSDVIVQMESRMQQLNDNEVTIPDYVWNAIWEQGRERETASVDQMIDEINTDFAARGFMLPVGAQIGRIDQARQKALIATNTLSREQTIQHSKDQIENVRFHVQQGIAFESMRGGWYQQAVDRALDAAKYSFESVLHIFKAEIELLNGRISLFNTQATVYNIEVQAEVAQLEVAKTEIEAQKLISDINKDTVAIYNANVRAAENKASIYKMNVDAAVAELEPARLYLDKFGKDIDKFGHQIREADSVFTRYKTEAEVKGIEVNAFSASASAFSSIVAGYKANIDAKAVANQSIIDNNKNLSEIFSANIESFTTTSQSKIAELKSRVDIFNSEVQRYKESADVETAILDNTVAQHSNQIAYSQQAVDAEVKRSELTVSNSISNVKMATDRFTSAAQVNAGIAAAAMSAAHVGMTESYGRSKGCTDTYNHDESSSSASSGLSSATG